MLTAASPRSLLFVPADRPERFVRAAASGADAIILDLEDAVAPSQKAQARRHVSDWIADRKALVRINASDTEWFEDDITLVRQNPCPVMIPKVDNAAHITAIIERLPDVPVLVLLETAVGICNATAICAVEGVTGVAFGSVDLGAELGVDPSDRQAMAHARGSIVLAAAAAGVGPPLDGVCVDFDNAATTEGEARYAASMGFGGKLCIHPRQVAPVNLAFSPSDAEISWAKSVVEAGVANGVAVFNGKMIDKPVLLRAERILSRLHALDAVVD